MLTFALAWFLHHQNEQKLHSHVKTSLKQIESAIHDRFEILEYNLSGLRSAATVVGPDNINNELFAEYATHTKIARKLSSALGYGYIKLLRQQNDQRQSLSSQTNKQISSTSEHVMVNETGTYIIQYLYPEQSFVNRVIKNITTQSNIIKTAVESAKHDRTLLSHTTQVAQADGNTSNITMAMLPVYNATSSASASGSRLNDTAGWVFVLLDIENTLKKIGIAHKEVLFTLTESDKSLPFYNSHSVSDPNFMNDTINSEMSVLGKPWTLHVALDNKSLSKVSLWNIKKITLIGLFITMLFVFLLSLLRPLLRYNQDNSTELYKEFSSVGAYFNSTLFKKTWPPAAVVSLLIISISSWLIIKKHMDEVVNQLDLVNDSALYAFRNQTSRFTEGAIFLAHAATTESVIASPKNDVDTKKLPHLTEVFKAYMLANPNVIQARFIVNNSQKSEVLNLQRTQNTIIETPPTMLKNWQHSSYVIQAMTSLPGNVYLSKIASNFQLTDGSNITYPTWQFSAAVENQNGDIAGIVVISVNSTSVISKATQALFEDIELYITNSEQAFIYPSSLASETLVEAQGSLKWRDRFTKGPALGVFRYFELQSMSTESEHVWVRQAALPFNDGHAINFHAVKAQFPTLWGVFGQIGLVFLALVLLSIACCIIQYLGWHNLQIKRHDDWLSKLETQRAKEMTRFKALLNSAPDATLIVDEHSIIQMVNAQAIELFGYQRDNLEGRPVSDLIPHKFRHVHKKHVSEYVKQPKLRQMALNTELYALNAQGEEFPVEISLGGVKLDEQLLITATVRNIRDRLIIEEQLKQALIKAEKATEAKSIFLANTSHEIRTPLNAIIGLTHLLIDEPLSREHLKLVEKIQISGNSLLSIVNNVLDLSKIEANEMPLEELPVELRCFLDEIASIFIVQAQAKGLNFELQVSADLPQWVITDSTRLRQILINLLSNAVKFTELGRISLKAKPRSSKRVQEHDFINIQFSVCDSGIGISKHAKENIFKPFTQADDSTTRKFGGTGLGLSIVSKLVCLLKGSIEVESIEEQGSQFIVTLPMRVSSQAQASLTPSQNAKLSVLIAQERSQDTQQVHELAVALGWHSKHVRGITQLVKHYHYLASEQQKQPDAVIIDWQCIQSGDVSELKKLAANAKKHLPPIIVVSDHIHTENDIKNKLNFVFDVLKVPISASDLFNAINNAVIQNTGDLYHVFHATKIGSIKAQWLAGVNVLVVDDSQTNLDVASSILTKNGAKVDTANAGEKALAMLRESAVKYDVVLMDVQMPGLDGLETTKLIRQSKEFAKLPIIALTAGALLEEKERALSSGMNDFVAKPFAPETLIKAIREALAGHVNKTPKLSAIKTDAHHDNDDWPSIEGLDIEQAKHMLMGDKELFFKTLERLLNNNSNLLSNSEKQFKFKDLIKDEKDTKTQIHKLKGTAGMIGASALSALASKIEADLRNGMTLPNENFIQLIDTLHTLKSNSSALLLAWKESKAASMLCNDSADIQQLSLEPIEQIVKMLQEQDLAALDKIESNITSLHKLLPKEQFVQFQTALENLNFIAAADILMALYHTASNSNNYTNSN
ncbi:hypothetical protein PA25_13730 [Pseudoalteromonas sp. A25]|nr:hypothetical protein PA25_13730 [Pseudoalteromonas sp. A25]